MSERKTVMLFISLIASLSKVSQGFEIPCNASNSTMKIVQFCPLDEQTYIESAKKKNCPTILNNCKSFEYHCLSNRQKTALIEVCAPSLNIIGNVCGTYHEGFNSIRSTEKPCPNCPFSYNSTVQFRYPVCYELLTSSTATQNTAPQELSSSPPETKDTFSPDILIENKKNFTKNGQQPGITINTQSQWKWEYILIAALGLAFLGTVIFIIVERRRKKGNSKSKTDIEANIHLLSNEDEKETQRTGQRSMAISSPGCIEMFDKDQTPNTPVCMDNSVSSQTLLNEQLPSSLMSSDQPTAEAYESGPAFSKEIKVETQQPGQRSMTTSFSCGTGMSDKDQILPQNAPDYIDKSETSFEERQTTSLMLSEQLTAEPDDSETSNLKADVQANISTDIKPAAPSFSDEIKRETQRKGQRSIASSSPDCTEMSDKNQTPKTSDCKDNTVLSQPSSFEQQPSSLMSSEQSTTQPHQSGRKPCFLGETSNSKTDIQANISSDIKSAGPGFFGEIQVETQQPGQKSMTTSFSYRTDMSDINQTLPQNAPDCVDKAVSLQTSFKEKQTTNPMSCEQPTAEPFESETSNSKADVQANISTDIKPAAPSFSDEIKRETQRKGQRSIASSSPDCTEMSDKNQTPKTSDCKDNTVLSQPSSFEQQPSSLMSSEQSTTQPHQSGRKPCFLGDIKSAGPGFFGEIQDETQQPGQRSMTTSFSHRTEMSDQKQTLPQNAPDCVDKAVSLQTSFKEKQTTYPMSCEQPTAEPFESETSNSKNDVQANISTDIKPAAPSFSDEVKGETQRKGQRSIASSSPDCTEMSDKDQTPNTIDCKDNTVLSQPSSYEQQPSSLMSSEQSTAQPHQSDGSMLSMKMSMDDHPEDQERSEKEQALPLNVSDCMDNPSCKDQPQPATCSGQPTGEIGSIQSRSLSAVSPLEAGNDNEATPKAVDDFEIQPLAKDSISTQETSATEDPDKNQQSEASMVRKPPDKRSIPVEDNTNQNPVNMDSKKSQIAINVFGNSTDNANFSIFIDRTHLDIPLSATISRENINQHPNRKKDPKAIKKNCTAELEIRGSGTTPIFNDDADQEQSFFYNQEDIENVDINFLRNENRVLKEEISQLKDLREREKMIERREENMAERERVMAERENMLRDIEKTWQAKNTKENK